ncbi:hypothetical protein PUV54_11675 [Hyphococcus flavus]|uniref:DUF1579 domain-containing protein n=1 Tax=Hyphococcus flavus TaxID=1866326 RepID=A0AAF0CER5_9PROT|nr:hypothetical protein [Hyphococcus flavus]WDI30614.1 hypothetical protein PUV54_11675 [Hyphococcus flavus]
MKNFVRGVACAFVAAFLCLFPTYAAEDKEHSIADLDFLLGKWRFVDESTEIAGFEYREEGEMICESALDERYIACHCEGASNGKTRHYVNYYSYNNLAGEFQLTSLFGNYPEKSHFRIKLDEGENGFSMIGDPMRIPDGRRSTNWSVISLEGPDRIRWETRLNRTGEAPDHWPLKFVATYERVE